MKELLEKIKRLSHDKAFGILTRNALEEKINKLKKFNYVFIDLCNLKKLNNLLGYDAVNKMIRDMFSKFNEKDEYVIGRWFSGDEIVIIAKDIEKALSRLIIIGRAHNISFKWIGYNDIKSVIEIEENVRKIDLYSFNANKQNEVEK